MRFSLYLAPSFVSSPMPERDGMVVPPPINRTSTQITAHSGETRTPWPRIWTRRLSPPVFAPGDFCAWGTWQGSTCLQAEEVVIQVDGTDTGANPDSCH